MTTLNTITIEETLDEVEKYWENDRTESARAIMRYAEYVSNYKKADWLRSEIEKLEARQEEIKESHIGIGGLYTAQVEMEVILELTSIITRYKEELKVLTGE